MGKTPGKRGGSDGKYKPVYCKKLVEHMKQGLDFECFAPVVGVTQRTLYNWKKKNKEFAEAYDIGFAYGYLMMQKIGIKGMMGQIKNFNVSAWIFSMKHRFGWRDRHDINQNTNGSMELIIRDYGGSK